MLPSFILRCVCSPKLSSVLCRIPKANLHLGIKYSAMAFCILRSSKTKFLRTSIILALPNTCFKIFSMVRRQEMGNFVRFRDRKKMLDFFPRVYMVLGSFQCRGVLLLWHMVGLGPAVLAAGAGLVGFFPSRLSNASSLGRRLDILKYCGLGRKSQR